MLQIQILPEFLDQFNKFYESGKERAKNLNIAITGLCRNVEPRLKNNLKNLESLANHFNNCYYFIYENDSNDNTPKLLQDWSNNTNKIFKSEKLNASHPIGPAHKDKSRTEALAQYRNVCKKHLTENCTNIDYVLVCDLDFSMISIDGLIHSIGYLCESDIKAMCGNSFIRYTHPIINYDSWAYRYNWWNDYQQHIISWFGQWTPMIGSTPFKINSGFGGSCIYNSKFYLNNLCQYEGYDCEHVCLHKNLYTTYSDFNLYINPAQIMIM